MQVSKYEIYEIHEVYEIHEIPLEIHEKQVIYGNIWEKREYMETELS